VHVYTYNYTTRTHNPSKIAATVQLGRL